MRLADHPVAVNATVNVLCIAAVTVTASVTAATGGRTTDTEAVVLGGVAAAALLVMAAAVLWVWRVTRRDGVR
ncbi:MAG TPA: hypothetical protein VGD43_02990 [Micromonospora sp.]